MFAFIMWGWYVYCTQHILLLFNFFFLLSPRPLSLGSFWFAKALSSCFLFLIFCFSLSMSNWLLSSSAPVPGVGKQRTLLALEVLGSAYTLGSRDPRTVLGLTVPRSSFQSGGPWEQRPGQKCSLPPQELILVPDLAFCFPLGSIECSGLGLEGLESEHSSLSAWQLNCPWQESLLWCCPCRLIGSPVASGPLQATTTGHWGECRMQEGNLKAYSAIKILHTFW